MIDKSIDVLGFQRSNTHSAEAERMQLICDERQYPLPVVLGRKAAIAVAQTQLL
jgi:hypothetical protein